MTDNIEQLAVLIFLAQPHYSSKHAKVCTHMGHLHTHWCIMLKVILHFRESITNEASLSRYCKNTFLLFTFWHLMWWAMEKLFCCEWITKLSTWLCALTLQSVIQHGHTHNIFFLLQHNIFLISDIEKKTYFFFKCVHCCVWKQFFWMVTGSL